MHYFFHAVHMFTNVIVCLFFVRCVAIFFSWPWASTWWKHSLLPFCPLSQLLLRNFNRVRRCIMFLINTGCYINSCFEWDSPQRSICAFVVRRGVTYKSTDLPDIKSLGSRHRVSTQNIVGTGFVYLFIYFTSPYFQKSWYLSKTSSRISLKSFFSL